MKHIEPLHDSEGDLTVRDVFQVLASRRARYLVTVAVAFDSRCVPRSHPPGIIRRRASVNLQKLSSAGLGLTVNVAEDATDALTLTTTNRLRGISRSLVRHSVEGTCFCLGTLAAGVSAAVFSTNKDAVEIAL
jgi:hypothetical protein